MKLLHALPPYNFCGVEGKGFDDCRVAVLPVPYDSTASYGGGARNGPGAIIGASRYLEGYDDELKRVPSDAGIFTLEELEPALNSPEAMVDRVDDVVTDLFEAGKFPIVFGGDHAISLGALRAASERFRDLSVLHIDAHADFRDEFEGTKFSHACAARRFSEHCPVSQFGVRSLSAGEADALDHASNVKTVYMRAVREKGLAACIKSALAALTKKVYVSFDVDALDPSQMPATGTPEPGGLDWYEALALLREACARKQIVGFDLVELAPIPGSPASEFLAAKLAYKFIGYQFGSGDDPA